MRVGFYPCCGADVEEPLRLLRHAVDFIVFCDINPKLKWRVVDAQAGGAALPEARFEDGDAREVLMRLERIDVLFYRRDSMGEGGSGVAVNSRDYLGQFVRRLPPEGGYLVTDGSNERNNVFRTMNRSRGLMLDGWRLKAEASAGPNCSDLTWIRVSRDAAVGANSVLKAQA
jgi:hypothetical protein